MAMGVAMEMIWRGERREGSVWFWVSSGLAPLLAHRRGKEASLEARAAERSPALSLDCFPCPAGAGGRPRPQPVVDGGPI